MSKVDIPRLRELLDDAKDVAAYPPLKQYIQMIEALPALLDELEKLREFKAEAMEIIWDYQYVIDDHARRGLAKDFLEKWSKADG